MDKKPKIFRLAAGYFLKRFPFRYFCLCIFMFFNSLCKLLGRRKIQCENCRFLRLIEGAKFSGLIERGEKKSRSRGQLSPKKSQNGGPQYDGGGGGVVWMYQFTWSVVCITWSSGMLSRSPSYSGEDMELSDNNFISRPVVFYFEVLLA